MKDLIQSLLVDELDTIGGISLVRKLVHECGADNTRQPSSG